MDLANVVGQWLLDQLQMVPAELLRQRASLEAAERLLARLFGERESEELRALLASPPSHKDRVFTVLLPGIMGSLLASIRGISAMLWVNPIVLTHGELNLLELNDDGTADRSPDVEIVPIGLEKLTYLKLILSLAKETRLYEFPYDWRRHLEHSADLLHRSLERWAMRHPDRRFALVAHSMGGLVARTYLGRHPREAERRISRVIMLGTPLHGAAITALVFSGHTREGDIVSRLHPGNDVAAFASGLPSCYQLLPPPPALFPPERAYPMNWDIYDASAWRLKGIRQDYLDDARRLHELWARLDPQVEMINIVGCHQRTLTDIWLEGEDQSAAEPGTPDYTLVHQERGQDSGDGQVPLWSTRAPGVATYYVQERHQLLPACTEAIEAILEILHDGACPLPTELPEPSGLLEQLMATPLMRQVSELRERIENGEFGREDLEKILFAR